MIRCSSCKATKNATDFNRNAGRPNGLDAYCKACRSTRKKAATAARRAAAPQPEVLPEGTKRCCHCREIRPLDQFKRAKNRPDGYYPECKPCCKARYQANRAGILAYAKAYYDANAEERRAYARQWRESDPERAKAVWQRHRLTDKHRVWRAANRPMLYQRARRWAQAHPEHVNAYALRWQKAHPENGIAQTQRRKARRLGNGGRFTGMEWRLLKAHYRHTCLCCGQREPAIKLQADHVIPLAKGGSNDIGNIQPLCGPCNRRKHVATTDYRPAWLSAP